jgi:hypothetical protein
MQDDAARRKKFVGVQKWKRRQISANRQIAIDRPPLFRKLDTSRQAEWDLSLPDQVSLGVSGLARSMDLAASRSRFREAVCSIGGYPTFTGDAGNGGSAPEAVIRFVPDGSVPGRNAAVSIPTWSPGVGGRARQSS